MDNNMRTALIESIEKLAEKHSNAIPVFCTALGAYKYVEENDLEAFSKVLMEMACYAKFHEWKLGVVDAMERFCHLCLIDPMIIEAYLGMRLKDIANNTK